MSEGMAVGGRGSSEPAQLRFQGALHLGDQRKESVKRQDLRAEHQEEESPPQQWSVLWRETTLGWRKVACHEADMPLKGLPSLKKWCQRGPARSPCSPVLSSPGASAV